MIDSLPLRVLVVIPAPAGRPSRDFVATELVTFELLVPPTEQALKKHLAEKEWHVLHYIGQSSYRPAAQYGTLVFETATRIPRNVSTLYLRDLLAQHESMELVVIERFDGTMWDRGPSVIIGGDVRKLYASLAIGSTLREAAARAQGTLQSATPNARLVGNADEREVVPPPPARSTTLGMTQAKLELELKRAAGEFDVFLCHNTADKWRVREVADQLEAQGILPWLDERELPPGQPWQLHLEEQINNIHAAAVFVGSAGVGPWQQQEIYSFLTMFVERQSPVIPVLLHDAPAKPKLPIFLKNMTWIDFRTHIDSLERLIWGITGKRPST